MKKHPSKAYATLTQQILLTVVGAVLLIFLLWLSSIAPGCAFSLGGIFLLGVYPAIFNFLNDLSKKE